MLGCLPKGCLPGGMPSWGVFAPLHAGVCLRGCLPRGVSAWGCLPRGCLVGGACLLHCMLESA